MKLDGRRKDIFDILYESGRASVKELSDKLYVCEMTIRRDLREMEKEGIIKRYRGGAVLLSDSILPISQRMFLEESEKKALAAKAAKYLKNDINVYIDSSSTCQYIITHIKEYENIKIVTNSVKAVLMASKWHIPCFLLGGEYYEHSMCLVDSYCVAMAEKINVDIAFFTTLGISDDGIISDCDTAETAVRLAIMKNSQKNIFLFEKSKIGKKFLFTLCNSDFADDIIT